MAGRPSKIGKYDVIDVLGRGGMGVVYKANDPHLNRLVAIKMMTGGFSDNPDLLKRFYREAQSTGNLQHPNIVTVYDLGDLEGTPYLVMEYLEGETLDAIINSRNPLTLLAKINFICDVCHGLAYAHHHGIVHRDIKPGNVMVLKNGSVKIVDFGIAHIGDKTVTRTGQLIGSLGYMSPEQVNGKPIDTRTDIFSAGVVLYQLLTYNLPFDGDSTAATLLKIIHDDPPPLSKFLTDVPPELEDVIRRSLAKDREERYRTVEDLGFDLAQIRDRLKEGMVEGHLREAESLLSRGFTHKAKELVLQILKIDRQHTGGMRLFRVVQQQIEQEQIGVQIKQLRSQAEEAFSNEQFEAALGYVDKALSLHQTDIALQSLKASISEAKTRAEDLQELLHQAEEAHQEGELDVAKKLLEETLELAPNDLQAKALFRVIHREWEERSKRAQVGNLVESARKEIASRRFTAALNVLKEAEVLDPNAPDVKSLIESASAGREQERHRRELESINQQIEEALDRDDFVAAGEKIDQGLLRFPEDRALLKLKALTEKQKQVSERKHFIDEQLKEARALMQAGRNEQVLELLGAALQKVGNDPHLQSLQVIVRETVERERTEKRKSQLLQRAKESLRRKEFSEAISALEAATTEFQHDPDLADLLQFAKEEAAVDERQRATDVVVENARALIDQDEYDEAVRLLEAGLPDAHEHEEELRIALAQARNAAAEYQKRLDIALSTSRKLLQNLKSAEAVRFLESQPASFRKTPAYNELLEQARRDTERVQTIESAVNRSRQLAGQRNFDEAFRVVEECGRTCGDAPELQSAVEEIEEHRSTDATKKLELVMADGRMLMMAKEYRAVLDRLKPARDLSKVASSKLRTEFETLESQAGAALVRQRRTQIEQLLRKGEHVEAADLLRGSQTEFPDNRSLADLKKKVDDAVERRVEIQNLLNTARRLFGEQSWQRGGEACVRAISLATLDPWLREQAIEVALRAADSAVEKDWRSAETLVHGLTEVRAGTAVPASLRARIAGKKREQVIQAAISEARGLQERDLPGALDLVNKNLVSFPDDPGLKQLQSEIQQIQRRQEEQTRLEQERAQRLEHLKAVTAKLDQVPRIDGRILILEEALRAYPDEVPLQRQLADLRELTRRVAKSALTARTLEESKQYVQAIEAWKQIQVLDPYFSETAQSIDRLNGLQRQELEARRVALIGQTQSLIAAHNLEAASKLLAEARTEFPDDQQLLKLAQTLQERANVRTQALNLIAEGQKSVGKKQWDQGAELLQKAAEVADADPPIREQAVSALLQAAGSATSFDLRSAENVANAAARLAPSSAELEKIRADLEDRKQKAAVAAYLGSSQKLESAGDLAGALRELEPGLRAYPKESQLLQRKQQLEAKVRAAEAAAQKERQIAEHQNSGQRLLDGGDLPGALNRVKQALAEFPGEARLLRMKAVVEKSISEAEEKKRLEQERKHQEEGQRRLREEKAAREEEKRKREEAAEKLRLEAQVRAAEEAAQKERRIAEHQSSGQRLLDGGDLPGALNRVKQALAEFPGEARLLRMKAVVEKSISEVEEQKRREQEQKRQEEEQCRLREEKAAREEEKRKREEAAEKLRLEAQVRAAEEAAQKERRIAEHQSSGQRLLDGGDLSSALNRAKQALAEFPGEARLLRLKGVVEKSISEVEEQKRREQERKRQEEEQRRLREEKAAREEEKRKREEAAEKLRLERARQRQEEAQKKAEEKKLRERERQAKKARVASERQQSPHPQLWKRPAVLAAIGVVALLMTWGGAHYLSTRKQEGTVQTPASKSSPVATQVNPLELQQRAALDDADKKRVAGDLPGASRVLQDAVALNGPLTGEIQKMQTAIQAEMTNDQLRKLRQQEARLWQEATSDVDRGQFRAAEKYLNNVLALPEGGIRRDDAQKYLREVIPQRMHELDLLTQAKQAAQKNDQKTLKSAITLLDQVVGMDGPRKSDAEQLRQQVHDKLASLNAQQQQKLQTQQIADLEASAQRDVAQGDLSSARRKVDQIKQAGGDTTALAAGIAQADKVEQARQQGEVNYQQILQKYQQSAASNDKKGLESSRTSLQAIAQGGGPHVAEARGYLNEIDAKLAMNQAPPAPVKTEIPPAATSNTLTSNNDDDAALRSLIKKYELALEQRNVDAMQSVWPTLGKKRYERYKRAFESATSLHMQAQIEFQIEKVEISQDRQRATVSAQQMQTNTLPGKGPESRQDKAVFQLSKSNGVWVISDVQ